MYRARQISEASLFIWDEAPGTHADNVELVSELMSMLIGNDLPFGGKPTVLSGDFRQLPPIVHDDPVDGPPDVGVLHASLLSASFWERCILLRLHANVRLQENGGVEGFTPQQLAQIGDGSFPTVQIGDESCIRIPDDLCLPSDQRSEEGVIRHVWNDLTQHQDQPGWMVQRAILAATYETVDQINAQVTASLFKPHEEPVEVLSRNEPRIRGRPHNWEEAPPDIDNVSGLQPHCLLLKLGLPVMLPKNDHPQSLANGSAAVVRHIHFSDDSSASTVTCIDCELLSGRNAGKMVKVERIHMSAPVDLATQEEIGLHHDQRRRLQFPMRASFAYTIRKSQGQTLQAGALYLPDPVRGHGDLYTALTRFSSWEHARILALSHPHLADTAGSYTPNVVRPELLATGGDP